MKKVYFVFKNTREADYFFRNIADELKEINKYTEVITAENKIVIPRLKIQKENFIKKILIKFKKAKRIFIIEDLEINFRNINTDFIDTNSKNVYSFFDNKYETNYFLQFINKI